MSKKSVSTDDLYTIRWAINKGTKDSKAVALATLGRLLGETPPLVENFHPGRELRVALVVGHNSKRKGAYAPGPIGEYEYTFNGRVADLLEERQPSGSVVKVFRRTSLGSYSKEIDRTYSEVSAWVPDIIVELHFNGYNGRTGYSCMLSAKSSPLSIEIGNVFQGKVVEATGFKDRGVIQVGRSDRGGRALYALDIPTIITEPFFGDYLPHATAIHNNGGAEFLAGVYADAITTIARKPIAVS